MCGILGIPRVAVNLHLFLCQHPNLGRFRWESFTFLWTHSLASALPFCALETQLYSSSWRKRHTCRHHSSLAKQLPLVSKNDYFSHAAPELVKGNNNNHSSNTVKTLKFKTVYSEVADLLDEKDCFHFTPSEPGLRVCQPQVCSFRV